MRICPIVMLSVLLAAWSSWAQQAAPDAAEAATPRRPIETLKPMHLVTRIVVDGQPNATIVRPKGDTFAALAQRIVERVRGLSGATLPIVVADEAPADIRQRRLIALGNMANNAIAFDLYVRHQAACDALYPGRGGFVLRTVHDPWGTGSNVLMLGGSDDAGVAAAVDAFLSDLLPGRTIRVPQLLRVQIPGIETMTDRVLAKEQAYWRKRFVRAKTLWYGATHDMRRVGELYFLTGQEAYAQLFAEMARRWIAEYNRWAPERQITTPKYAMPRLILTWDAIEESPFIPDDLKLDMLNLLCDYVKRMARHWRIRDWKPGEVRVTGHLVCLSVVYGARYFKAHYPTLPMEDINAGLKDIVVGMDTLASTPAVLSEDGYWHFHPETIALYSLATGDRTFFRNGMAAKMCEYAALCTSPTGSFHGYMSKAIDITAWFSRDPRWKWLAATLSHRGDNHPKFVNGKLVYAPWTFPYEGAAMPPVEFTGVHTFPLDATVYHNIVARSGNVPVPVEAAYRQAALRAGFARQDQYLLLDGINVGLHKVGDGNAVRQYVDRGAGVLTSGKWGATEMKYQNTVLVSRDGQGPKSLPVLAELELQADLQSIGFVQSRLPDYNGVDWYRSATWLKNRCVLVTDIMQAGASGDYSLACQWRTVGKPALDGRTLTNKRRGITFTIRSAAPGAYLVDDEGVKVMRRTTAAKLEAGQARSFAHLLYATPDVALPQAWQRWQSSPETAFLDRTAPHAGKACVSIKTQPKRGWQCLRQTVALPKDATALTLTAAARTNGRVGARVYVLDPESRRVLKRLDFTAQDWEEQSVKFDLPKVLGAKVEVWLSTTGYTAEDGQVWIDDVSLVAAGHNLVRNRDFEHAEDGGRPAASYDIRRLPLGSKAEDMVLLTVDGQPMLCYVGTTLAKKSFEAGVAFNAQMCVLAADRFACAAATRVACGAQLLQSDVPVSLEHNLETGRGVTICERETTLWLACPTEGEVSVDGEVVEAGRLDGRVRLQLARGRHVFALPRLPAGHEIFAQLKAALAAFATPRHPAETAKEKTLADPAALWKWAAPKTTINAIAAGRLETGAAPCVAVATADGYVHMLSDAGKKLWSFRAGSSVNDVLVADLDADGKAEVVAACSNYRVYCLDAAGKKLWEFYNRKFKITHQLPGEYGTGRYIPPEGEFIIVRAADLDGDGKLEVVAGSNTFTHGGRRVFGTIFALSHDGKVLWHTYQSGGNPCSIDLSDVDGDGRPEITLATGGPTYARSNYLLTSQGEMLHRYCNPYGPERIRFVKLDPQAAPGLVTADERSGAVTAFDAVQPYGQKWTFRTGAFKVVGLDAADLDNDGADEAIVTTLDGNVYAIAAHGKALWRRTLASPLSAACVVHGPRPAIAVGGLDGAIVLLSATGEATTLGSVHAEVRRLLGADVDGDGQPELIVGTEAGGVWAVKTASLEQ